MHQAVSHQMFHVLLMVLYKQMAETFLVRCLKPGTVTEQEAFDEIWLDAYSSNALKINFE